MTFSQKVKSELVKLDFNCEECSYYFLCGIFMLNKIVGNTIFISDNKKIINYIAQTIVEVTGAVATIALDKQSKSMNTYSLKVENDEDLQIINKKYSGDEMQKFTPLAIKKECCKIAFLRGVFISCGIIVNPQKEYHLEFKINDEKQYQKLLEFMPQVAINFKKTVRKGNFILYIKESEQIENLIAYLGAINCSFEIMNVKIEKELRNKVNRQTNCETANLQKTAKAAVQKNKDIKYIIDTKGIEFLPEELQEVALIRIMNPESSLSELVMLLGGNISRSGLNHRLTKLQKIAKELKEHS